MGDNQDNPVEEFLNDCRSTITYFSYFHEENPHWNAEDLRRHVKHPPGELFERLASVAGFKADDEQDPSSGKKRDLESTYTFSQRRVSSKGQVNFNGKVYNVGISRASSTCWVRPDGDDIIFYFEDGGRSVRHSQPSQDV